METIKNIPTKVLNRFKAEANEMFSHISDYDYCYNYETEKYDLPSVEVEDWYGKRWVKFKTIEERNEWVEEHIKSLDKFINEYINKEVQKWLKKQEIRKKSIPTLENLLSPKSMDILLSFKV